MSYKKMWFELMKKITKDARWHESRKDYATEILDTMSDLQIEDLEDGLNE